MARCLFELNFVALIDGGKSNKNLNNFSSIRRQPDVGGNLSIGWLGRYDHDLILLSEAISEETRLRYDLRFTAPRTTTLDTTLSSQTRPVDTRGPATWRPAAHPSSGPLRPAALVAKVRVCHP